MIYTGTSCNFMKKAIFGLIVAVLCASPATAAGLKMTIGNGHVSIDAQDVTVRQILTEWARLGKTRVINLEGLASGPITLKLDNVPENVALDIILRAVPGYMAAPRPAYVADASVYDRILIMATSSPLAAARTSAPAQPPPFQSPNPNVTALRPPNALVPGMPVEGADDPSTDPAIAAAAAAGLLPAPAPMPGAMMPGPRMGMPDPAETAAQPAPKPSNPFNVPTGAARPGLAPPAPPPAPLPDTGLRRPPQADR